jgi:hypothetical protein
MADREDDRRRSDVDRYDRGLHPVLKLVAVGALAVAGATAAPVLAVALPLRVLWGPQPGRGPAVFAVLPLAACVVAWAGVSGADMRTPDLGPTELLASGVPASEVFRGALAASFGYVDAIVRSLRESKGADAFAAWGGWQPFLNAYLHDVWRGAVMLGAPLAALWSWRDGLRARSNREVPLDPKE